MPVIHPEKICIYPICSSRSEVLSPALIFNMGVFPLKTAVISLEPVRFVSPCFAVFLTKLSINLYASSTARAWWPSRYSFSTVFGVPYLLPVDQKHQLVVAFLHLFVVVPQKKHQCPLGAF